jgi:hypothetical protein
MDESIVGSYFDTLNYIRDGNYSHLRRMFNNALRQFNLELEGQDLPKLRKKATYFLQQAGLLEIDYSSEQLLWCSCPGYIVSLGSSQHVCIGGTRLITMFSDALGKSNLDQTPMVRHPAGVSVPFYPTFPQTSLSRRRIKELTSEIKCPWYDSPADFILNSLPDISLVFSNTLTRIDSLPEIDELEEYDFDSLKPSWIDGDKERYPFSGLFRRRKVSGGFDYFLIKLDPNQLCVYRTNNGDWIYLVALYLLDKTASCKYFEDSALLYVPSSIRLPVLIKRILFASKYLMPELCGDGYICFKEVKSTVIDTLIKKYTCLELERG